VTALAFIVDGARCGVAEEHARELARRLRDLRGTAESPAFAVAALIESCAGRRFDLFWTEHELAEIRGALCEWIDAPLDVAALRKTLDSRLAA
jgi:hypothetical protein